MSAYRKSVCASVAYSAEKSSRIARIRLSGAVKRPVVDMIWEDFVDTAREIQQYHGQKKDMNVGRHCSWCDYQPLCKALMTGSDVDWLIKREYEVEGNSHKREEVDRSGD